MTTRKFRMALGLLATGALALSACSVAEEGDGGGDDTSAEVDAGEESTDDGDEGAGGEITTGQGVTEEPCPDSPNPDNGCIYLGILSDLTEGPFAALAVPITDGQVDFWDQVNDNGGIEGYDVDVNTYTRDTKYQAAEHAAQYNQIAGEIAIVT